MRQTRHQGRTLDGWQRWRRVAARWCVVQAIAAPAAWSAVPAATGLLAVALTGVGCAGTVGPSPDAGDAGDTGTDIAPPRPVAPLSTATVSAQLPTFRFALAAGTDGARLEVCRDRAFTASCQRVDAVSIHGP